MSITFSFNTWNHSAVWGLPPTLPEQIAAAAEAGYDFVGLDVPSLIAHRDAGLAPASIASMLADQGIGCYELVPLSVTEDRAEVLATLTEVHALAVALGARQVLAVARGPLTQALVESTRICTQVLGDAGVGIAVEFLPSIELNSIDLVRQLLEAVDRPGIGVMVDSWHFFAGPNTWASLEHLPADKLGFVQFSDRAPAVSDDVTYEYRQRRLLPGEGTDDLHGFAETVLRKGGDVTVSVEVLSEAWRMRPPADLALASYPATRHFWTKSDS